MHLNVHCLCNVKVNYIHKSKVNSCLQAMSAPLQAQACHISRRHGSFIHWRWDLSFHFASCLKWSHGITWRPPRSGLLLCPESLPRLVCKQSLAPVLVSLNFKGYHIDIWPSPTKKNYKLKSQPSKMAHDTKVDTLTDIAPENRAKMWVSGRVASFWALLMKGISIFFHHPYHL